MAKVTAVAKQTLHGSYGLAVAGETIKLEKRHAEQLEAAGLVEITGEAGEEEETEKKSSFNITDNTGKAKEKAEQDTDENDPTGEKKVKEKNEKAGPKGGLKPAHKAGSKK